MTGGAGFIGSAVIRDLIENTDSIVMNIDKLTYAGNLDSLSSISESTRYSFKQVNICDRTEVKRIFSEFRPDIIMHLAAESHVDRSIDAAGDFVKTNIVGTYELLEVSRDYNRNYKGDFKFHHVSTDEVYGDLGSTNDYFLETTAYSPSSPYSATKASSDHLVRAWGKTYGLPVVISNCSNNYGPFHFPEKLIPLIILNALKGKQLPIYGDGKQIRDWLYVEDHARALRSVAFDGKVGETYNIGGNNEKTNLEVVEKICETLNELVSNKPNGISDFKTLITFVKDRPGHDLRYAIDASKIKSDLGWSPEESFETGIKKTVDWYLENEKWWSDILNGTYSLNRIGLGK